MDIAQVSINQCTVLQFTTIHYSSLQNISTRICGSNFASAKPHEHIETSARVMIPKLRIAVKANVP